MYESSQICYVPVVINVHQQKILITCEVCLLSCLYLYASLPVSIYHMMNSLCSGTWRFCHFSKEDNFCRQEFVSALFKSFQKWTLLLQEFTRRGGRFVPLRVAPLTHAHDTEKGSKCFHDSVFFFDGVSIPLRPITNVDQDKSLYMH